MLNILATTAPIFLLIALGFAAVRMRLMPPEAIAGLGRFVLYISLPALIFSTISRMNFAEVIEPHYLLVYALGSFLTFSIGLGAAKFLARDSISAAGIKTMGMSLSNSAFIGYPVLMQVFDNPPANAFAMCLIVENLLIFPLALVAIEYGNGSQNGNGLLAIWKAVFARVLRNPLIMAILAGVIALLIELPIPHVVGQALQMLSGASSPIALFVVGASLASNRVRGKVSDIGTVVTGKLILHPLMVALMVWLLPGFEPRLQMAAIIMASMPMLSIYPIIGDNYGYRNLCASALLAATALSFITITVTLQLVR